MFPASVWKRWKRFRVVGVVAAVSGSRGSSATDDSVDSCTQAQHSIYEMHMRAQHSGEGDQRTLFDHELQRSSSFCLFCSMAAFNSFLKLTFADAAAARPPWASQWPGLLPLPARAPPQPPFRTYVRTIPEPLAGRLETKGRERSPDFETVNTGQDLVIIQF